MFYNVLKIEGYGISAFSLSQDLGVTVAEAREYMDGYFAAFPGVRHYMDEVVKKARETGYVETLFHRRRDLPELISSNKNMQSFGERVALNMPIQGTAADVMKLAMAAVWKRLRAEKPQARLVLQVHDELIVECPEDFFAGGPPPGFFTNSTPFCARSKKVFTSSSRSFS